jgi:4-amino-4-deoxy-L-arabinose transferase-like glycosyltransferase
MMKRLSLSRSTQSRVLLLMLTLFAFGWRTHGLTLQSLWRDEVDAVYFALRPLPETLSMFVAAAQNGPLYFLSLRPWFQLVGSSEFAVRYPSALAGTLSVVLVWGVAQRLLPLQRKPAAASVDPRGSNAVALLAAMFMALNPYQLWYSQEGKMYTIIVCLMLISSWLWLEGIHRGGWRIWLAYLAVTSISMYTHLLMVLVIPLHLLWFFIAWPQSVRHWRGYGAALAGLTLPYLPMVWWQWAMLTANHRMTGFTFTPLGEMLRTLLYNHGRGFMPPTEPLWMAPIFFVGVAGAVLGITVLDNATPDESGLEQQKGSPRELSALRRFLLLLSWLLAPIVLIYGLSLRQPVFVDRYIIWIAPAAMMVLALGIAVIWRSALWGGVITFLLLLYIGGFWLYAGWEQKTSDIKYDLRSAVTYLENRRQPDELLILQIPHMEYSYRYYSGDQSARPFAGSEQRLGRWAGGLWTNNGHPDAQARAEVDAAMRGLTHGVERVWVLRSEVEMWDARHLMDQWLDEHGTLVDQAEFHGSQVRVYDLSAVAGP